MHRFNIVFLPIKVIINARSITEVKLSCLSAPESSRILGSESPAARTGLCSPQKKMIFLLELQEHKEGSGDLELLLMVRVWAALLFQEALPRPGRGPNMIDQTLPHLFACPAPLLCPPTPAPAGAAPRPLSYAPRPPYPPS